MKARIWCIYFAFGEYDRDGLMWKVAQEKMAADSSIDFVQVYERGGWHLTFARDGTIVGTANDRAILSDHAKELCSHYSGAQIVGETRRETGVEHKYNSYYPCLVA